MDEEAARSQSSPRTCPWCGAASKPESVTCSACGAALAERESLGGIVIPGVTTVDPALQAYDAQPWHLPRAGGSPSQSLAGGTIAAAAIGGPTAVAALGGLAAMAAVEYLTSNPNGGPDGRPPLDQIGRPSEAAMQMLEKLEADPGADAAPLSAEPTAPGGAVTESGRVAIPVDVPAESGPLADVLGSEAKTVPTG